jgi:hypothetical protein
MMNMTTQLLVQGFTQNEMDLLQGAFDALRRTTGLEGRLVARPIAGQDGPRATALVEIAAAGKRHQYVAVLKRVDRFAALGMIKHQLERYDKPGLLVAPYITPEVAERCRTLHLCFIDTVGNAYLHAPGLLIFVQGQRTRHRDLPREDPTLRTGATAVQYAESTPVITTTPRGGTATALRVAFVVLCRPGLLNAPYREISRTAGVALGAVSGVLHDLHGRGYITGGPRPGKRRLLEPQRLFEEWVTNYPLKLRPKLRPRRFRAMTPGWWQQTDVTTYGAQWGGEVAADKLTGYLKPETVTLYIRPEQDRGNVTGLITTYRLRADPQGNIEMLDTFWVFPVEADHPDVVPPILVYADLVAMHDSRALDAARLLYDRKIAHALRPA